MAKPLKETTTYQRNRMWNALGVAIICFIAMIPAAIFSPDDPFGYILGFGFIVGIFGFFDHRKELKRLRTEASVSKGEPQEKPNSD